MTIITWLRFASYAICAVVFFLIGRQVRVIPIHAVGPEYAEAAEEHRRAEALTVATLKKADFQHTHLSGSEVIALAEAAARKSGDDLSQYGPPMVSLDKKSGRLSWYVAYYHVPSFPGGFFTVEIDDATKATTIHPGM